MAGLAAAALVGADPAAATQSDPGPPPKAAPANSVSGVTLTAPQKLNPQVDPTTQFVRQHLPESPFSEQYPRFRDDVCVEVVGLPPEYNDFVARRIVEVASQVRAPVGKTDNCRPNIDVVFSPQPQAVIADIAKRKDIVLGFYWNERDLKKLATFTRPIGAWYVTRTRASSARVASKSMIRVTIRTRVPAGPAAGYPTA